MSETKFVLWMMVERKKFIYYVWNHCLPPRRSGIHQLNEQQPLKHIVNKCLRTVPPSQEPFLEAQSPPYNATEVRTYVGRPINQDSVIGNSLYGT